LYENNTYVYFRSLNEDLEIFPIEFLYNGGYFFSYVYNISRIIEGNDKVAIFSEIRGSYKIKFILLIDPIKSNKSFYNEAEIILSAVKNVENVEVSIINEEISVSEFLNIISYADIIHYIGEGEINSKKQLGIYINSKGIFWLSEIEKDFERRPNLIFLNMLYPSAHTFFSGLRIKSFFVDNLILPPFQILPNTFAKEIASFYKSFLAGKSIGYALLSSFKDFYLGIPFFFYGDKRDKLYNRKIYLK